MRRKLKDSEVDWIGLVPATWFLKRLKNVCRIGSGVPAPQPEDFFNGEGIPFLRVSDLSAAVNGWCSIAADQLPSVEQDWKYWKPGTIVFPKSGESIRTNVRARLAKKMVVVSHLACVSARKVVVDEDFLFWFLTVVDFEKRIQQTALPALGLETIGSVEMLIPGILEQKRISGWINLQTVRLDSRRELLSKKRELLQDLKRAVIEEATFRGIAKGVEMRDSEIVWLGQVPTHWLTVRIGSLFREAADAGIDGLPMLSVSIHSGISDKELDEAEMERKVSRSEDRTLYKRVKPGDLVYNQMRAWQGAFGAAKIEGLVSPAYVVARPGRAVVPRFVEYLLRAPAAMEEIRRRSRGITDFRLRLYWNEFKNIRIALPPLAEQGQIAAFLDRKLSQINRQIDLIDQLDDLLKQQRKALIFEAVTGKIDLSTYEPPAKAPTA